VGSFVFPLAATLFSKALQDRVTREPRPSKILRFVNRLNITATRPASALWLSFKYHLQPSVPTGDWLGLTQAIGFFFVLGIVFFGVGGYLTQQILSLWFMDTYLNADNWKLFFGGLLFWNTMYLLRYGIFLLFTGVASFCANYPLKFLAGLAATAYLLLEYVEPGWNIEASHSIAVQGICIAAGLAAILLEKEILGHAKRLLRRLNPAKEQSAQPGHVTEGEKSLFQIALTREQRTLGIVYMSGDDLCARKLSPDLLMTRWAILRDQLGSSGTAPASKMAGGLDEISLRRGFDELYRLEQKHKVTLWHPNQIHVAGQTPFFTPESELSIDVESDETRRRLLGTWHLRRWLVSMMSTGGHSQDTAINLAEIAARMATEKLAEHTVFYLVQNKYDASENNRPSQTAYDTGELGERNKLARLLCALAPGARAYSLQNWTPFGFKAGGLTGMDLAPEETMRLTSMLLLDRNATVHDLDALIVDLRRALSDPDIVIVIPGRGTTNTLTNMGQGSQMVEEGHRSFLKGLMGFMGGTASEAVGTGWGNLLAIFYGRVQRAMLNPQTLKMPLTSRMQRGSSFQMQCEGLIGFTPHAVGISEDTWAVSQAAHNAIALGHRVKFLVSTAMWHKIRETWSHAEWLASFPRWSGGYLQMMHDPLMQKVNDFGPASVFAKEVRANSGRNFLSAPFALFNILLMPLAIMLDLTPFVQILIVLWNFGFVMNQILTVHGLNTYLESSGFQRFPALLGGLAGGAWAYSSQALRPVAPALILGGFLTGGFFVGLSRWLYTRLRDMLLFGPQLVLHALGQVVRQTLEFQVSGASPEDAKGVNMAFRTMAGPREDKPLEPHLSFINLRTVVWGFGMVSVGLNLVALSNLDMLNVLLLLPSLLFSVSTLAGPFLLKPRVGKPLGIWAFLPKALGWLCSVSFFTLVSMLLAAGNRSKLLGLILVGAVFGTLLLRCARYWNYRPRLRRLCRQMTQRLHHPPSTPLWKLLLTSGGDRAKFETAILWLGYTKQELAPAMEFADRKLFPLLLEPGQRGKALRQSRFISELNRSLALSLLVLVWFFVVPLPGLFVFTAGDYRISLDLWNIMFFIGSLVAVVIIGSWLGQLIQWFEASGRNRLKQKLHHAFVDFQKIGATSAEACGGAGLYALFTDAQLYLDQQSYGYARELITRIEKELKILGHTAKLEVVRSKTEAS
jgi:hypothetical protein